MSRKAKKKQAVRDKQVSYLQVAPLLKLVNALNKPKLRLRVMRLILNIIFDGVIIVLAY